MELSAPAGASASVRSVRSLGSLGSADPADPATPGSSFSSLARCCSAVPIRVFFLGGTGRSGSSCVCCEWALCDWLNLRQLFRGGTAMAGVCDVYV